MVLKFSLKRGVAGQGKLNSESGIHCIHVSNSLGRITHPGRLGAPGLCNCPDSDSVLLLLPCLNVKHFSAETTQPLVTAVDTE